MFRPVLLVFGVLMGALALSGTAASDDYDLLKDVEGYSKSAYLDSGGIPTICTGHVSDDVYPFQMGDRWTDAKCAEVLEYDLWEVDQMIDRVVTVPLNVYEYEALRSFVFNIGVYAFRDSTLLKVLNEQRYLLVPDEMRRWVKYTAEDGSKKTLSGLVIRREKEIAVWLGQQPH